MDVLYIVMPAYNEEETIKNVIKDWYPMLNHASADSRLVVADSGSTDLTHAILLELKDQYPKLEIISNTGRQHGPKVIALYHYAIKKGADYIFQTDSDGQTDPKQFYSFWQSRDQYSGIFGKRPMREDGRSRAFVEQVVCFLLKMYFGVQIPDANAPFRLMKASVVEKYLYKLPPDYDLPNIMLTTYYVYYKEKMVFRSISFKPRQGGVNSINLFKVFKIGWKALGDFGKFKKEMK